MGISYSAIDVYCASHILGYENRVRAALKKMRKNKCPLIEADPDLYWSMNEAISYWGLNNNENVEDVDVLDVIYSV